MRFAGLGIRGRIYAGIGSLLALGLALGAAALLALFSINREVSRMDATADRVAVLRDVSRDFETIRNSVQRTTFGPEKMRVGAKAAQDALAQLQSAVAAAQTDARRQIFQGLVQQISTLEEERAAWATLAARLQDETAKQSAAGEEMTTSSERLFTAARASPLAGKLEAAVLLARLANWRFFATHEAQAAESFKSSVAAAHAAIADLEAAAPPPEVRALIAPVKASLDKYAEAFALTAADTVKDAELHDDRMLPLLVTMRTQLDAADSELRGDFANARSTADGTIAATIGVQELVGAFAVLLGGFLAFRIAHSIVAPIASMTRTMGRLAGGDTQAQIPERDAQDEIGSMARALEVFRQNAIERVRLQGEISSAHAGAARQSEMHRLADEFEREIGVIVSAVSAASAELERSANDLTLAAGATRELSADVATASDHASANVVAVAGAADQLARSVDGIAHKIHESSRIAEAAVRQAAETEGEVAKQTEAAGRISEVIQLITSVAEQTNLLALNATIEAARAGPAGKGFAVVAQEVKALALQTAKATEDIARQIAGMQAASEGSAAAIKAIAATIYRVSEITSELIAAIEAQSVSTRDIAQNSAQAEERTSQVRARIAQVDHDAAETGTASARVLASAKSLAGDSSALKTKVDRFLATVRAA